MRTALVIVDLQNDFCEGGSVALPGGNEVAGRVARHLRHFKSEYAFAVATRDHHEDPPDHFSDHPDFNTTWPPHCLVGTPGAAFKTSIQNLVREKLVSMVVEKGRHAAAYSGFDGLDPRGHTLEMVLKDERIDRVDVCGLATEFCVRATALDARAKGFAVRILINLCGAVSPATGQRAFEEMKAAGCELVAAQAP